MVLSELQFGFLQAAADAIREQWQCEPLYIREGGTMRVTPFLEETIGK